MNQALIVAELVILKALRSKLLPAMLLLLVPFLIAAWGFEANNTGFQSGFAVDIGGSFLAVFAAILLLTMAVEHFYWPGGQAVPWFYLSRIGDRTVFIAGKFMGVAGVLFLGQLLAALTLLLVFRASSGIWPLQILTSAFMVFLEFSLLGAVLSLLALVSSKVLATGSILLIYVTGHNLEILRRAVDSVGSKPLTTAHEIILTAVPDFSLFRYARLEALQFAEVAMITLYALLMIAVYLVLAGMVMRRKDL